MSETIFSKRCAEAFLEFVKESNNEEKVIGELDHLNNILKADSNFYNFLFSKEIDSSEKILFIENVLGKEFSSEILILLFFVVNKGIVSILPATITECHRIYISKQKMRGIITSARPLNKEIVEKIKQKLKDKYKKNIELKIEVDPGLIGGIKLVLDNKMIDGSVKCRLKDLKEKLISIGMV
ncbi:ATPase, F1 complex, OSCP/delta subunit [Candidatus Omnitrophus magneticus]|uniref:ATP synthase subunit delta n=1 Tax=Candidatus Omnitrophus magneticus TaxID=1609969 RepID=A0A0F0CVA2_9BACT|nr:ATPase, F1 complex, OSCP/delta subunit [Candidatus Omnitrophus magneticus]